MAKKIGNFLVLFNEEDVEIAYYKRFPTFLSTAIETRRFHPVLQTPHGWTGLAYQGHIYPALRFSRNSLSTEEVEKLLEDVS